MGASAHAARSDGSDRAAAAIRPPDVDPRWLERFIPLSAARTDNRPSAMTADAGIADNARPGRRVVLTRLARMHGELLEQQLSDGDITVIQGAPGALRLVDVVELAQADFAIADAGRVQPDEIAEVLDRHPRLKVLSVSGTGRQALLYELRPHRVPIGDLSSGALLTAIRGASRVAGPAGVQPTSPRR